MGAIPETGQLEALPLPRLLLELHAQRFSGALLLSRERTSKKILLHKGVPFFAESNLASESLGVQLLDEEKISREDYSEVVKRVQEHKCKEGAALLALNLLSPKELFLELKEQVRRRILECFSWAAGEFQLEDDDEPPEDAQAFRVEMLGVVQDGLERHWSPERILAELGSRLGQYPVPGKRFDRARKRVRCDQEAEQLLASLDGSCTLGVAIQNSPSPSSCAIALLFDAAGFLRYRDAPPGEKKAASPAPRRIEIVFSDERDAAAVAAQPGPVGTRAESAAGAGSDAVAALRAEVLDRHAKLEDLDHYGILGVARDAEARAIKRAYFGAAKRYHPDALASLGLEEVRREANAVFARIAKAYSVLSDPKSRRNYDAELDGAVQADANRLANAESLFRKAEILLRKGDFAGSVQYLQPAVALWPEDPAYQSCLGWALFKKTPPDNEAAREHLERAVELDGKDAVAHLRLGAVLRALGEKDAAQKVTARAKELDPKADLR